MVAGFQAYIVTPALEGCFLNILDMNHINPDADWWSKKCNEITTVNGQLYMITGDIALSMWESIYTLFFNKQLASEYNIGDLYELVKSGKWTLDKLYELSEKVLDDLHITTRGEDGFMKMSYNTERTQNALEKLVKLYSAQSSYKRFAAFNSTYINLDCPNMFRENRALFAPAYLKIAAILHDMNTDFGIIPLPKYDEIQENYYTTVHDSTSMICFPNNVKDENMSALIAEALCVYSHYDVIPKYYDISLKTKSARDTESEAMIDLIRDSLTFDFGAMYTVPMGGTIGILGNMIVAGDTNFASKFASIESTLKANLEKINEAYGKKQ